MALQQQERESLLDQMLTDGANKFVDHDFKGFPLFYKIWAIINSVFVVVLMVLLGFLSCDDVPQAVHFGIGIIMGLNFITFYLGLIHKKPVLFIPHLLSMLIIRCIVEVVLLFTLVAIAIVSSCIVYELRIGVLPNGMSTAKFPRGTTEILVMSVLVLALISLIVQFVTFPVAVIYGVMKRERLEQLPM